MRSPTQSSGRQDLQSIYQPVIRALEEQLPADLGCVCRYEALKRMPIVVCVGAHSEGLAASWR